MTDTPQTVTFKDRTVAVKTPSSVQIAAWNRAAEKFGEFADRGHEGDQLSEEEAEEFRALIDKLLRIVLSLLAEEKDRAWFEELALDGEITDEDLRILFEDAMKGLKSDATQGPPAKKAARRR